MVGIWPISSNFRVVQFNSNLLPGQASVHSVQWSMTWVKRLPPLSCSSILVVATPSELFLRSLFIWRQLSFERCSNLWGSLWPHNPSSSFNWSQLVSDWLILTMLCHADLLTFIKSNCSCMWILTNKEWTYIQTTWITELLAEANNVNFNNIWNFHFHCL